MHCTILPNIHHARRQPARREQLGGGVLLRDTSTLSDRTNNLPVTSQPVPPPEPHVARRESANLSGISVVDAQ